MGTGTGDSASHARDVCKNCISKEYALVWLQQRSDGTGFIIDNGFVPVVEVGYKKQSSDNNGVYGPFFVRVVWFVGGDMLFLLK